MVLTLINATGTYAVLLGEISRPAASFGRQWQEARLSRAVCAAEEACCHAAVQDGEGNELALLSELTKTNHIIAVLEAFQSG
jgi:hypothetical protein